MEIIIYQHTKLSFQIPNSCSLICSLNYPVEQRTLLSFFFLYTNLLILSKFFQVIVCSQGHNSIWLPSLSNASCVYRDHRNAMPVRCAFSHHLVAFSKVGFGKEKC